MNGTIRNKRWWTIVVASICCCLTGLKAQSVTVDASIDSLQILIGEQTKIRLETSFDAGKRAVFPLLVDTIVKGVEIVEMAKPDTQYLNNKQRLLVTQEYTVTSFDSALYYLPPFEVQVDGQPHYSQALALKVYSMPVDTLHPEQFFGQKPVMEPAFVWKDFAKVVSLFLVCIPIVLLIIHLIKRFNDNKPIIRKVKVEPKLPPHELAMKEIERIKDEKIWQKGRTKEYYTELTEAIRTYIKERFGFNALEMTSSEIIEKLLESKDKESIEDLKNLFTTADLVKFAKHAPLMNENDMNLVNAIDFINQTKQEAIAEVEETPKEITIEEKRSRRGKVLLGAGIAVAGIALVALLVVACLGLYDLFF